MEVNNGNGNPNKQPFNPKHYDLGSDIEPAKLNTVIIQAIITSYIPPSRPDLSLELHKWLAVLCLGAITGNMEQKDRVYPI